VPGVGPPHGSRRLASPGGESRDLSSRRKVFPGRARRAGITTTFRPGTKGRSFRGATHIRRCRSLADGSGSRVGGLCGSPHLSPATPADRCCPLSLALCAGAYWRALEARGSVRRLTGPFSLVAAPASTNRWFSMPAPGGTRPDHSPYWECGGSLGVWPGACQTSVKQVSNKTPRVAVQGATHLQRGVADHVSSSRGIAGMRRHWPWSDRPCGVEVGVAAASCLRSVGRAAFWTCANPDSTSPGCAFPEAEIRRDSTPKTRPITLTERPGDHGMGTMAPIAVLLSGPVLPTFAYVVFETQSRRLGAGVSEPACRAAGNGTTAAGERHETVGEVTGEVTADSNVSDMEAPSGTRPTSTPRCGACRDRGLCRE
jgi:hypothetical protein